MRPETAQLTVEGLAAGYGSVPILRDVSLQIGRGETVAVIGRNGAGKSTLMKSLAGLLPVNAGAIRFNGTDISHRAAFERARLGIGYVPQGRELFPELTVAENLRIGMNIARRRRVPLLEPLQRMFPLIVEAASRRAAGLSGGQQQQVAIARALVGHPSVLLLDEPSEGIQPSVVRQVARSLLQIRAELGISVLLVEQNIEFIRACAQRCYVMEKGAVIATLTGAQLRDDDALERHLSIQ